MLEAKAAKSSHTPSPGYFVACRKKYLRQPLTPTDHEEIAIERLRTDELFDRGKVRSELRQSRNEIRNTAMLVAYEGGESVESIAKAYNWTISAVRLAIKSASQLNHTPVKSRR